jgi:hypothetical protein
MLNELVRKVRKHGVKIKKKQKTPKNTKKTFDLY